MSKKNSVGKGAKPRQLKTLFGDIHFTVPRRRCQACGKYFRSPGIQERLCDFDTQKGGNITKPLRRIATLCGASWPYEQAADVIFELTGVVISHDHIMTLCDKEARVIKAEQEQNHDSLYNAALVETMESLVDYLADEDEDHSPDKAPSNPQHQAEAIAKPHQFYMGIDGVYIGAIGAKKSIEAKVGIVFTDERAEISKGRNLLLNKQYTGTYQPVDVFGQRLFDCAREMGITDKTELIILGDGARWITKLAKTQYPKATLILDWWHLKERVWETVDHLKQEILSATHARKWGKHLISLLWRGKAKAALKTILKLCKRLGIELAVEKNQKQLGESSLPVLCHYVWHNQDSIVDYHSYQQNGSFISSVFAEKAIDILVCRRQKLRGQNWSRRGAENVLILRQLVLNDQWSDHWQTKVAA